MSALADAWSALRHGGNLLSPAALDALPEVPLAAAGTADRLRAALVALPADEPADGAAFTALLDFVLEDAAGPEAGWTKGSAVGAADAVKLLDGTTLKPRRVWRGPQDETLAVFTTDATRVGVGKGRRPVAHVLEYLRRRSIPLAVLTNGREWRLVWADADSTAWVEGDADRWLDADQLSPTFHLWRRLLAASSLQRAPAAALAPLLQAVRDTRRGQGRLSKELGENVRRAVETLLRARRPVIEPVWGAHDKGDLYVAACHVVMRLVVVLFAEARELLPVDNPIYHQAYGLRGLLDSLDRAPRERRRVRHSAWSRLLALFKLLHAGSPHPALSVLAYGGDLFRPGKDGDDAIARALAVLESTEEPPDDETIHQILVKLTRTETRLPSGARVAAPVDFSDLTSEYIGILYEGLLDYELHRAGEEPVVFLNLGDQPALPLGRLEGMSDAEIAALVAKAKVKKKAATEEDGGDEDEEADDDGDEGEDTEPDAAEEAPASALDDLADDARARALARAQAWAERAAVAGKLVRKPRRGGERDPAWRAELEGAARQLLADLKLPGELFLVRWGGTRKGAGTFYTRPQLTLPTVRRTLRPLTHGAEDAPDFAVRTPEELLALKVCDPAMGSGSFLVAALRVLTDALEQAIWAHGRIAREDGRTRVDVATFAPADRVFDCAVDDPRFAEWLRARVRRYVVEHCLYGVDLDPLAVELARVALWVETLDARLPFTFLDHKLRCGNALVGTWFDRFRDYPLHAWSRKSPDEKWKGVHHPADTWAKALKERRDAVVREQAEVLSGQGALPFAATSDEQLQKDIERVRALYRDLRAVPAGRPDERARIWRERIRKDAATTRVREAFDLWCALWFWPLDRVAEAPGPRTFANPGDAARETTRTLTASVRFFHWELEFPDVFVAEGAGFDAVVGNPPWEIQKPNSKEFFSNHDPLYRSYGKQEALGRQKELWRQDRAIEETWLGYLGGFKYRGNFVSFAAEPFGDGKVAGHEGGDVTLLRGERGEALHKKWRSARGRRKGLSDPAHPFRYQGSADLNTYKMFVEVAHALAKSGGHVGMIVPSGLYSDKGARLLRRVLLERCAWRWLYGFENRDEVFDIHRSFKFCITIAQKGSSTSAFRAAFMRHQIEDWTEGKGALDYGASKVHRYSPKSLAVPEIRSARDGEVLDRLYDGGVLLGEDAPEGWGVRYANELHMTNDSALFLPRNEASDVSDGRWVGSGGTALLPVYEGRMLGQFDFSQKGWVSGRGRSAVWREIEWGAKAIEPQYLIEEEAYHELLTEAHVAAVKKAEGKEAARAEEELVRGSLAEWHKRVWLPSAPRVAFMDVTAATNQRTMIAAALWGVPCGNSAPVLLCGAPVELAAVLNSFAYDYVARLRCCGLHLNWFVIEESAVLPGTAKPWLSPAYLLIGGEPGPMVLADPDVVRSRRQAVVPHERLRLRAMLDAIVAVLYGLDRDHFAWILRDCDHPQASLAEKAFCRTLDPKGFWRVDKDKPPELRHTVLSLVAFDALQACIAASGGDRDKGIEAFCAQNGGDGWLLPDTLRLADHGLGHDDRAQIAQPVASALGPRFLDWQLAQSPEESWAECERHARAILGDEEFERRFGGMSAPSPTTSAPQPAAPTVPAVGKQAPLFPSKQQPLFPGGSQ